MKNPHVYEKEWKYMFEILEELEEKAGISITSNYVGRIARRKGLTKGTGYYKRYHESLVEEVLEQMKKEGRIK